MISQSSSKSPEVRAFAHYLRTGRRLSAGMLGTASPIETKFNPYHDPKDGRFTFGPGGSGGGSEGVYRPDEGGARLILTGAPEEPPRGIGDNGGPPLDPIEIEQAFPGWSNAPASAILAVTDPIFNLTGPGHEATTAWALAYSNSLIRQIQAIDPSYHFESLGFPGSLDGQLRQIDQLRWDRAVAIYRKTGNAEPLQTETLRFIQRSTDAEYTNALALAKAGKLPISLSDRVAVGNYMDRVIKEDYRQMLAARSRSGPTGNAIRISGREYDSSGSDLTYSIPDFRVADIAYDVTIWRKTPGSRQIRRFFNSDFKPKAVIIVRPKIIAPVSTYIITRPRK